MDNSKNTPNLTEAAPVPDNIDALEVSDSWKKTFRLIKKAEPEGPFKYKKLDELDLSERRKMNYNFIAFFFSGLYYLWKGMYKKGFVILGASWIYIAVLTFAEGFFSVSLPDVFFYIPPSVICAILANYDYYKKVVHKKQMWEGVEIFKKLSPSVAFAAGALLLFMYSITAFS